MFSVFYAKFSSSVHIVVFHIVVFHIVHIVMIFVEWYHIVYIVISEIGSSGDIRSVQRLLKMYFHGSGSMSTLHGASNAMS
jgi:hypothetical protein